MVLDLNVRQGLYALGLVIVAGNTFALWFRTKKVMSKAKAPVAKRPEIRFGQDEVGEKSYLKKGDIDIQVYVYVAGIVLLILAGMWPEDDTDTA